jgi:CBS domain containing-hemolysin-like protein
LVTNSGRFRAGDVNDIMAAIVVIFLSFMNRRESFVQRDDGSGSSTAPFHRRIKEYFDMTRSDAEDAEYHTLGGFIMAYLGRFPYHGDRFLWVALFRDHG